MAGGQIRPDPDVSTQDSGNHRNLFLEVASWVMHRG
jgi:hypothetical protein